MGLELALKFRIRRLDVYGDSELIIKQLTTEYEVRHPGLQPYYDLAQLLIDCFSDIRIAHVPRKDNAIADALANFATAPAVSGGQTVTVKVEERSIMPGIHIIPHDDPELTHSCAVSCMEVRDDDGQDPLIEYLQYGRLPSDPQERERVRRRASQFTYLNGALYRQAFDGLLLRCLSGEDAKNVLAQAHSSECGGHLSGQRLHRRIQHMEYYWPSMAADALEYRTS